MELGCKICRYLIAVAVLFTTGGAKYKRRAQNCSRQPTAIWHRKEGIHRLCIMQMQATGFSSNFTLYGEERLHAGALSAKRTRVHRSTPQEAITTLPDLNRCLMKKQFKSSHQDRVCQAILYKRRAEACVLVLCTFVLAAS